MSAAGTGLSAGGTVVNDGRLGFFSDIHCDPLRNEWWALSDRGPGGGPLGEVLDPEGIVVNPRTGHLLVSGAYGPSLYEINRTGRKLRASEIPVNLRPRKCATGVINHASDAGNTAGKRSNHGFEGLAVAQYAYRMEASSQGRGISALVALNEREFLVLERNSRGVGVDSNVASPTRGCSRSIWVAPATCPKATC